MIKPIVILRNDHCIVCNTPESLECYDIYNRPIYFSHKLDIGDTDFNNRSLSYFKCKNCKMVFPIIDWTYNREIPRPLVDKRMLEYFLEERWGIDGL